MCSTVSTRSSARRAHQEVSADPELLLDEPCGECGAVDRPGVPSLAQPGAVVCVSPSARQKRQPVCIWLRKYVLAPLRNVSTAKGRNGMAKRRCIRVRCERYFSAKTYFPPRLRLLAPVHRLASMRFFVYCASGYLCSDEGGGCFLSGVRSEGTAFECEVTPGAHETVAFKRYAPARLSPTSAA